MPKDAKGGTFVNSHTGDELDDGKRPRDHESMAGQN